MSGPQGSDPAQQWHGSQQSSDPAWQQPSSEQQPAEAPAWGQPPAYDPSQYPGYQQPGQPGTQGFAPGEQYGQQPPAYPPSAYPQGAAPGQYGTPPQYGQQPQYGQYAPYPQGAEGQQFPPYGAPPADAAAASKKSLALILGAVGAFVLVLVVAIGILGFWKPGWFVTTELDVNAAQGGVAQILGDDTNGYGAKNVSDVKCNDGKNPTVSKGSNFTCQVSIDGTKRQVTVTFQDDDGTYEVGRPK